ncbi:putative MFS-type transporter-like protein [Hapsidospora chrysogenum ATCC 11550]|uniref:Putative MFS-type transporter-like protein n=1 Tax=Hapsidospora chrysogenum (strain ATCC 11550 / CBS 779.69 / DSM 880 / IAM 14645 / JCM 23072 / IMI 49137) TaxID=857340 RepID=A0A086T3Z0_HAPC1|nr:putative MFS-type transporter-like protein [Hapsidospora chrysogenum ATCC 11550]
MATQTQTILQQPVIPAVVAMDPHPPLAADRDALGLRSLSGDDDTSATGGECDRIPEESASRLQKVVVVFQLSGVNFSLSAVNGLIIVGLPRIAEDLALPPSLTFWPASVSSLATSATLLLAGSVADALGPRAVDLTGCFLCGAFMLGCGLAKEGEQLVGMRAVTGVGQAMHLASSVALVTKIVARGRGRNVSFACLGLSQPLGFSFGLVLGGVLVDTIGWRAGFYIYGGLTVLLSAIGCVSLPKSEPLGSLRDLSHLIRRKVDWVGALLASSFMAFLSYFLAVISGDMYRIREPGSIVFLCLGVMSLPFFVAWVHRQVRRGRPALIPNSFWRNASFASICATISVTFAVLNSLELFASLL